MVFYGRLFYVGCLREHKYKQAEVTAILQYGSYISHFFSFRATDFTYLRSVPYVFSIALGYLKYAHVYIHVTDLRSSLVHRIFGQGNGQKRIWKQQRNADVVKPSFNELQNGGGLSIVIDARCKRKKRYSLKYTTANIRNKYRNTLCLYKTFILGPFWV